MDETRARKNSTLDLQNILSNFSCLKKIEENMKPRILNIMRIFFRNHNSLLFALSLLIFLFSFF